MNINHRDLILALLSAFLGSVKGYLVSRIKSLGAIEIFGLRSVGAVCFILPIVIFFRYRTWYDRKRNIFLFARSVIGNVAVCGYYYGFVYLPLAEASVLFYSTPIFTIIIGCLCLKEYCGCAELIATIISICGVCVICVPHFSADYSKSTISGIIGSLIGSFAQALALALVRKITEIPPFVVSFWWAVIGIMFSSTLTIALNDVKMWTCGYESVYLGLIATVGFISEVALVSALKSTDAVIVSIALTSEIMWAFILQYFANHETPTLMTGIGGAMIGISILLPVIVKLYSKRAKASDDETTPENLKF